ncbi:MAG: hypothetical protein K6E92_05005 [Lachnospiraceae bacterium]|nr:hypothetical protein [Lachnospiraceae bacterium]
MKRKKDDLDTLLREAFAAPEPAGREAFLKTLRPREVSTIQMLRQQAAYIRVPVWLFAALTVVLAVVGSSMHLEETVRLMVMLMPFTAALCVLETKRSERFGMSELEMATRYSLRSVVLSRMIVLGILSALVLCICAPVLAAAFGGGVLPVGTRILIPYLVTMSASLAVERSPLGRKNGLLSPGIALVVASLSFLFGSYSPLLVLRYLEVLRGFGLPIAAFFLLLTVYEQWKTIKSVEAFA